MLTTTTETDTDTEDTMALNVYTTNCTENAPIRTNGHIQYNVGLIMVVLGLDEVTDKNLGEVMCRFEFYASIENFSMDEKEMYRNWFKDSVGVEINGNRETWANFVKRMGDNHKGRFARVSANA
jgi:hypothetical protein